MADEVMRAQIPDEAAQILEANCRRGFAVLDEGEPGWWREIDSDVLDMADPFACTLGQLHRKHKAKFIGGFDKEYGFELPELPGEPKRGDYKEFEEFTEAKEKFTHECYKFLDICWSNEIGARWAAEAEEQNKDD